MKPTATNDAFALSRFREFENLISYWNSFCFLVAVSFAARAVESIIGYRAIGFLFLLAVLIIGFVGRLGTVLFAATLSWLTWNFFFIPPRFTFAIGAPEDLLMCATYFFVAIATGVLANRVKMQEELIRIREERTNLLYEVLLEFNESPNQNDYLLKITERVARLLHAECHVYTKENLETLGPPVGLGILKISDRERQAAAGALRSGKLVGWSTQLFEDVEALYLPIKGNSEEIGVLRYKPKDARPITIDQRNLLQSVCRQIGLTFEQQIVEKRLRETERLEQSEKIHQTLLNSISHELRTPLTVIIGSASALDQDQFLTDETSRRLITRELKKACERLNRVVENLLDMSRLNAGGIAINLEWHDISDLVGVTVTRLQDAFEKRKIVIQIPHELPLIKMDFRLIEHALSNILINAATYSPPTAEITISATVVDQTVAISVSDRGAGIAAEHLPYIFDKFFRVPGSPPGGTGLGLSIVKGILEFHEGSVSARNLPEGGARFEILLPLKEAPALPGDLRD